MIFSNKHPIAAAMTVLAALGIAHADSPKSPAVLHQVSTMQALMAGLYDGVEECGELAKHGDLGLGTFKNLDGELAMLDGIIFRINASGQAGAVPPATQTPFACTVWFEPMQTWEPQGLMDLDQLKRHLRSSLASENLPAAFKINGQFQNLKTRSVPAQVRPFPKLAEVLKNQPEFEFHSIRGTLVGFYFPESYRNFNAEGFHFHFLSLDRQKGGHVLGFSGGKLKIQMQALHQWEVVLPQSPDFLKANFGEPKPEMQMTSGKKKNSAAKKK